MISYPTSGPKSTFTPVLAVNINEISSEKNISILKIQMNPNRFGEFIIVNSDFTMNYLSLNSGSIFSLGTYAMTSRINAVSFFRGTDENYSTAFASGDTSGNISIWKCKENKPVKTFSSHGKGGVLSIDINDKYLCAGYGKEIVMWDLRTMKQIGKSSYAHSEAVTSVKLYENYLLSGGEDNVINIFNLNEKQNEKNLLCKDSVEMTINLGQSIDSVAPLESGFLSAITTVNTFHVVSLNSGACQYEFDAKNPSMGTDYILDVYYDNTEHKAELFCGSFKGGLSLIDFNLGNQNVQPILSTVLNTNIEQTFNSVGRVNKDAFITASDTGYLYVLNRVPIKEDEEMK